MDFGYFIFRVKRLFIDFFDKDLPPSEFSEIPYEIEIKYQSIFPSIGYGFLLLTLLVFIGILYPFRLFDPIWEFNAITGILDTVPYQFIGFGLIFFTRAGTFIHEREKFFLHILYWLILLLGIGYFLFIPLIIGDTNRLINNDLKILNNQKQNQELQIKLFQNKIEKIGDQDLIKYYQNRLLLEQNKGEMKEPINLKKNLSPSEIRSSLLQEFKTNQFFVISSQEKSFENNKRNKIKTAIIYSLTAMIDGFLMLKIFSFSKWIKRIH